MSRQRITRTAKRIAATGDNGRTAERTANGKLQQGDNGRTAERTNSERQAATGDTVEQRTNEQRTERGQGYVAAKKKAII